AGGATLIDGSGDLGFPFAGFGLLPTACANAPEEHRTGDGRASRHKPFLTERYAHSTSLPNCRPGDYGPRRRAGASTAPVTSKSTTPTASATGWSAPSCGPPVLVAMATSSPATTPAAARTNARRTDPGRGITNADSDVPMSTKRIARPSPGLTASAWSEGCRCPGRE